MEKLKGYLLVLFLLIWQSVQAQNISYDFELEGVNGKQTLQDFSGKYLLLSFGYTSCPDVCPTTLYQEGQVLKTIKNADQLAVVFISIDPKHDHLQQLHDYVTYFDPNIIGLTANYTTLKEMADRYGASFGYRVGDQEVYPPNLPEAYTVYHSTLVYLLNPQGEMIDVFDYQIGTDEMKKRISLAIKNGSAYQAAIAKKNIESHADLSDIECPLPKGFQAFRSDHLLLNNMVPKASGQPTLVNFWAVWCAPCREELPILDGLKQSQNELSIFTINLGDDIQAINQQFQSLNIQSLSKRSSKEDLLSQFHGVGLPFSVLYDQGKPVATKNGVIKTTDDIEKWAKCQADID